MNAVNVVIKKYKGTAGMLGLAEAVVDSEYIVTEHACKGCRIIKRACDGHRPCGTCVRRDVVCEDAFAVRMKKSRRIVCRARAACFECSLRKRKCDGQRPCARCAGSNLECVGAFRNTIAELVHPDTK